jgi:two-component system, cell cycle sensor histidine kinase and response regulator CckA
MSKKATIMVVDDEDATLQLLQDALLGCGYGVQTARNGAEAWKLMEAGAAKDIVLLLTDLVMPKMDGMELARRVSAAYPEIRILFTSGYADDIVFENKDIASNAAFMPKPFNIETLRKRVKEVLGR